MANWFNRLAASLLASPLPEPTPEVRRDLEADVEQIRRSEVWTRSVAKDITPEALDAIFRQADDGDTRRLVDLAYDIEERDGQIASTLQTRKQAVIALDWEVLPGADDARSIAAAQAASAMLSNLPHLDFAMLDLLDGISKPFAACEIKWDVSSGQAMPTRLEWLHQRQFRFLMKNRPGDPLNAIRLLTEAEPTYGVDPPPYKLVIFENRARSGWQCRAGLIRVLSWMWLFKSYTLKDWASFAESFGQPLKVAKVDSSVTAEEKRLIKRALQSMGPDGAAVVNKAVEFQFVERGGNSGEATYLPFLSYLDAQISKIVLGHTGSSDSTPGRLGGEDTATDVRTDLLKADSYALAGVLNRDLLAPFCVFNYGADAAKPTLQFVIQEAEDLEALARRDAILARDIGLPIGHEYLYNKYQIPRPDKDEETTAMPSWAAPSGGNDNADAGRLASGGRPLSGEEDGGDGADCPVQSCACSHCGGVAGTSVMGAARDGAVPDDDEIESLFAASYGEGMAVYRKMRQALTAAIDSADTMGGAIAAVGIADIGRDDLADLLFRTKWTARLLGMAQVMDGLGKDKPPAQPRDESMGTEAGATDGDGGDSFTAAQPKRKLPQPRVTWTPLQFDEAIDALEERIAVPYRQYRLIGDIDRRRAFSLATAESAEVAGQVQESLSQAMQQGQSLAEWRKGLAELYDTIGITEANPFHSETVFRNALQTSYGAGRLHQQRSPAVMQLRPYWQYIAVMDSRTRSDHADMHRKVYRADDPIWDEWYPPNGHNCRCKTNTLSQRQVDKGNITIEQGIPLDSDGEPMTPDDGWAVPPTAME